MIGIMIDAINGIASVMLVNVIRALKKILIKYYKGADCMDFVSGYAKAETFKEKIKCFIAKMLCGQVVTPLGRIMLLPKDYERLAIATGNEDVI